MDVAPSTDKEDLMLTESVAPTTGKVAVRILADDILPIVRDLDALAPQRVSGLRALGWTAGALTPPMGFIALLFYRRRQDRFRRDKGLRRRQRALKTALRGLRELAADEQAQRDRGLLARRASVCLRHYVGDRLGAEGGVLTSREVEEMLAAAEIEPATVRRCREVLERLEAAQYGALSGAGLEHAQLVRTLEQLVQELDRQTRGRKRLVADR